ncbi:alpha/beta hydrolase fold domain-containing protein [Crocinitomix algicola]|uniref:alpha/beta hydrolase fold domain-containing protein n=1 Tax=Crocinitomix algicola TaxID=1740263 RepID=UPI00082FA773|nr:alpha/beta hydrolase [Crocinitomix algicola]
MKQSLSYYLTLLVIRMKGIKKNFSRDPVDYKRIRKDDVIVPKGKFFKEYGTKKFEVLGSTIHEVAMHKASKKLVIFVHGGAFISGPAQHHWDAVETIAEETSCRIWLCNYPKAPASQIEEISANIDAIYNKALEGFDAGNIIFLGDSVGATLLIALTQRLIKHGKPLPKKLVLISPVMDASLRNPEIKEREKRDPMLAIAGILSAKRMCAGDISLTDPMISPIYGSFQSFPSVILFIGGRDIMAPDEYIAMEKMKAAKVKLVLIEEENMPHIWPILPVMKEAKQAMVRIIKALNS